MQTRELIKQEIDKIDDSYLGLVLQIIMTIESYSVQKKLEKKDSASTINLNSAFTFYDSMSFDMSQFHFDRDDANER